LDFNDFIVKELVYIWLTLVKIAIIRLAMERNLRSNNRQSVKKGKCNNSGKVEEKEAKEFKGSSKPSSSKIKQ
jgi:hypothetical protein